MQNSFTPESDDIDDYLQVSEFIDYEEVTVMECATQLSFELEPSDHLAIAKRCFEYVRDDIHHTADYDIDIITCKASDVLKYKTGFCYAKSHLLVALLRANNIPAGLCYQRLSIAGDDNYSSSSTQQYCLHGLTAIYLSGVSHNGGWYRVDARGNKPGVDAQFTPPNEKLAFELTDGNEIDFNLIYQNPWPEIITTLTVNSSLTIVSNNLPDKYN